MTHVRSRPITASRPQHARRPPVVEQVLVGLAVLLVLLSVLQVSVWIYTRSLLTDAAHDAARELAPSVSAPEVTAWVAQALGDGIPAGTRNTLRCNRTSTSAVIKVRCSVDAPGLIDIFDGVLPRIMASAEVARTTG